MKISTAASRIPLALGTVLLALTLASCSGSPAPAPAPAPPKPAPVEPAADDQCHPLQLDVEVQARDSAAGSFYWNLVFKNTGSVDCSLDGMPTLSLHTDTGDPIGNDAGPEDIGISGPVVIPAGGEAYSFVRLTQAGNYDCTTVPVDNVNVDPPGLPGSNFAVTPPSPMDGCDGDFTIFWASPITAEPYTP